MNVKFFDGPHNGETLEIESDFLPPFWFFHKSNFNEIENPTITEYRVSIDKYELKDDGYHYVEPKE